MVVGKSCSTHLIEDIYVIMMIYGWFGKYLVGLGLNLAEKKKGSKLEYENLENLMASVLAECKALPTTIETWWIYFYVKLDI